jgi:hypothetical protein
VGGRQRINIHGAIDLETGQTRMIEVETVDALSTIWGLMHKHVTHNKCYAMPLRCCSLKPVSVRWDCPTGATIL